MKYATGFCRPAREFDAEWAYYLLRKSVKECAVSLAQISQINRIILRRFKHFFNIEFSRSAGGRICSVGRSRSAAYHCGNARIKGSFYLGGAYEMDMGVNAPCG